METLQSIRKKQHLREVLLYHFFAKKTAAEAHRLLKECYGKHAISRSRCFEWFQRFKNGDFDVSDKERPGQPKKFDDEKLKTLLKEDSYRTQDELATELNVSQPNVSKRLKALGMVQTQVDLEGKVSPTLAPKLT